MWVTLAATARRVPSFSLPVDVGRRAWHFLAVRLSRAFLAGIFQKGGRRAPREPHPQEACGTPGCSCGLTGWVARRRLLPVALTLGLGCARCHLQTLVLMQGRPG